MYSAENAAMRLQSSNVSEMWNFALQVSNHDHYDEDGGDDHKRRTGVDRQSSRPDASERSFFWHRLLRDKADRQNHPEYSDEHRGKRSRKQVRFSTVTFEKDVACATRQYPAFYA